MKYTVINPFEIVGNAGTLTNYKPGRTYKFSVGDKVSVNVQSGSLGDLYTFNNHTTNETVSKMVLTYSNPFKHCLVEA